MEFVHRPYIPGETIAAVATATGEGGIAVVRISGNLAIEVSDKIFSGDVASFKSHTVHFGKICTLQGEKIDDVLLVVMLNPRSFTGEDTVEIQCHGGRLVTTRVLEAALSAGARAARPGEFSFKAFMNGKIDLAQAEAIQALIHAKNEHALGFASEQLEGTLSKKIIVFQKRLTEIAAILEAWVDFPEEDLEFAPFETVVRDLSEISAEMQKLIRSFHQGKIIHDGIQLSLVGSPNVGKSSLMNALLGKERAIVSPIAGTTRDLVEDDLRLNGLHFRLTDTAGIRKTDELIEEEGIRRSKKAIERSDLILFVMDAQDAALLDSDLVDILPKEKTVVVWNKIDLPHERPLPQLPFAHVVEVSAKALLGLDTLHAKIDEVIWEKGAPNKDEITITTLRHKESLEQAEASLHNVITGLKDAVSAEFVAFDIRMALRELGTIIGTNVTEDVLTAIFSKFCIGK